MKIKSKHGELTTQQIVMLIILIVSFAIILFFIFRLNLGQTTDKEVCHNSVVMQSQSKLPSGPIDCKTSYVCISGGGKCDGINPTETINIDLSKADAKNQTIKAIADKMSDCWWEFGEGKVNYVDKGISYSCGICSTIKFDKNIQDKFTSGISYSDFYNYLSSTKKDSTSTYLSYLYGDSPLSSLKSQIKEQAGIDVDSSGILFTDKFSIFTGSEYNVIPNSKDFFIPPYFVKAGEIPVQQSSFTPPKNCANFDLTKA